MRMLCTPIFDTFKKRFQDFICVVLIIMTTQRNFCEACGTYEKIGGGGVGYIASPANYGAFAHCIWWLETDSRYQLSINITYVGDTNDGRCGDYIIIRDGRIDDDTSIILDQSSSCSSLTNQLVTARSSWLMVQFKSDGLNTTSGFQGHITSTFIGDSISNYTNPIIDQKQPNTSRARLDCGCRSYEWSCSNRVCMTLSYRCDDFNDCGCDVGCDEYECEGIGLDRFALLGIAIGCGVATFVVFFLFAFIYESHLKRRTLLADPEAQVALQKEKDKKRRKAALKKAMKEKKERR